MNNWVSTTEKRKFLKWFMEQHQLKRTEARKVLEYILNKPPVLENVSFIDQIQWNRKTIVISSIQSDEPGFEFYYRKRKTEDVAAAIGEIIANPSDKLYLIIHFNGKMSNYSYLHLLESPAIDNLRQYRQSLAYAKEVNAMIDKLMAEQERKQIKRQIDEALDANDEALFRTLVEKLKRLPPL